MPTTVRRIQLVFFIETSGICLKLNLTGKVHIALFVTMSPMTRPMTPPKRERPLLFSIRFTGYDSGADVPPGSTLTFAASHHNAKPVFNP
jgi:hypothetical protein